MDSVELLPLEEAHKEMESRLLAGWTMLGEMCPISGYPLVRKGGKTYSIRCGMEVMFSQGGSGEGKSSSAAPPNAPAVSARKEDPRDADIEKRQSELDSYSKEISGMLLQGWTMLEADCPITHACPLMKLRSSGKIYSVAAKRNFTQQELNDGNFSKSKVPETQTARRKDPKVEPNVEPKVLLENASETVVDDDAQTRDISKKLLTGWTMLEDVCPVTHQCPLMKSPRDGRLWSAALGRYIKEAEMEGKSDTTEPFGGKSPPTSDSEFEVVSPQIDSIVESASNTTVTTSQTARGR